MTGKKSRLTFASLKRHFDYNFLRNAFRKVLLERLTSRIGPAFRKVKNEMYTKHADGFYVRAKPNLCTPDITIKYILSLIHI